MAGHTQRIEQRYVHGVGASGALLAGALIAFISVVGLVSLALWPSSVDTATSIDPGLPSVGLAAGHSAPAESTRSLSSGTVTTPLAAAQTTAAPAPTVPAVHPNRKPSHGGGKQKSGSGKDVTTQTNGGQVTVIQPTTTGDSRSGSGSGGTPTHGKRGTNDGSSGNSGGGSSQTWDQPSSGNGNGNKKQESSGSGDSGPVNGNGHAYGHNK